VRAVVLVGGFGTRLLPLTRTAPKQMLPVGNRPMIERVLEHLAGHGVTSAVLSLGYRPEAFRDAYPSGRCAGVDLQYAVDPEPLDTAGAIRFAAREAGIDERFIVMNGDILTDLDVGSLVAFHEAAGAEGTLALHRAEDPTGYGVVAIDATGRVEAFVEKPASGEAPSDLVNAGTYVLEPSVLERIRPGAPVNVERVTFPAMVAEGTLFAKDGEAYWIDAGTPATYLAANLDLLDCAEGGAEVAIAADAVVEGTVIDAWIGRGASVARDAVVERAVVFEGARIGPGAVVRDAIIGAGAAIGAGAVVEGEAVVGDGVEVAANAQLHGVRLPEED
jgi:mannose-1-phosphate guanylyltransferase